MDKREDHKTTSSRDYSATKPSSELTVDELINCIRDKIQYTLEKKARKSGRHKR